MSKLPAAAVKFDAKPIEQEKEEDDEIAVMESDVALSGFCVFDSSLGPLPWFFTLDDIFVSSWSLTITTD